MSSRAPWLVTLAVAAAAAAAGAVCIRAYDFGWHLQAGEWILSHGRPPRVDMLSFTAAGAAWIDHEWLFQALLAALVRAGGLPAAWGLKVLLVVIGAALPAWCLLRRGHSPLAVTALTLMALAGARFRFFVRPEMLGLALLPILLVLLLWARDAALAGRAPWPWLAPLPVLMALWVNLHPSALLGASATAAFSAGVWLERREEAPRSWPFLATAVAAALALAANPYGAAVLAVPGAIGAALAGADLSNPEWGPTLQAAFWPFWTLLACGVLALAGAMRSGRRPALPVLAAAAPVVLAAALTLRFVAFFYAALPALVLGVLPSKRMAPATSTRALPAAGLALLAAAVFLAFPEGAPVGAGLAPGRFPEAMASSFRGAGLVGPIYNPVRFGGYLSWALAPQPVFIDGRNELHAGLLSEMAACRAAGDIACWDGIMDRWGIEAAFVPYEDRLLTVAAGDGRLEERSSRAVFFRRQRWAMIDWDDTAMLLVRRGGPNDPARGLPEIGWLRPDEPDRLADDLASGRIGLEAAVAAAREQRKRHPESLRAALVERVATAAAGE